MTSRCGGSIFVGMQDIQPSLAEIAALVGNPARANMLTALLDGRALSASELAYAGGVAPQTASEHLAKLKVASWFWQSRAGMPITGLPGSWAGCSRA